MQTRHKLLKMLIKDSTQYKNIPIPTKEAEQRNLIRSLMNIRMPEAIPDELLNWQDQYLKEELGEKGIVPLSDIPTIKEQYGNNAPFAHKISLWQGDITRLEVGAIVNAANSQLLGCFIPCHKCIDNAIHSAAGMQLRSECNRIMAERKLRHGTHYEEPTGTATLTKAYNLPCDYVIHTVGPIVYGDLTDSLRQDLRNCYENVLKCCVENKISSVAFCCISTGEFHFPNIEAAKIALEAVSHFLATSKDEIQRVIFNVFTDRDKEIYQQIINET